MNNRIVILLVVSLFFFISCDKNDDNLTNDSKDALIDVNNDLSSLKKRISFEGSGVLSINNLTSRSKVANDASDFPLVQIAEVNAPVDEFGRQLQANHVYVSDKYAYVAYTFQGAVYSGAVDVIDISDPYKPKIIISALIKNTDITSLTYADGKLFLGAATDIDKSPNFTSPAVVIVMQLNNGLLTENYTIVPLQGQVTTDIVANGNAYFSVTGDKGSLSKNTVGSNQQLGNVPQADLRSVLLNNEEIITLSGTQGVQIYKENNLAFSRSFPTSIDSKESKRTMDVYEQKLIVAEGLNGAGVYAIQSGQKIQSLPIIVGTKDGIDPNDIVTNAVAVNDNKTFVANGAAGVSVYQNSNQLDWLGRISINGSSNYIKTKGDYIYVASGKGGLKIIKIEGKSSPVNCTGYPTYTGNANLILNSNQTAAFSGSTALSSIIVNSKSSLTHCGALSVQNDLTLNSNSLFEMSGTLSQGRYGQNTRLTINSNAEMKVNGAVVIYGDLVLNSNANLTFLGTGSSITIYGKVIKGSNVKITGNFKDTENKL
ncbi:hypothetical protein [Flavobacterium sp. TSSA_36]|uniref:hypothetical protein n=1 Tax=Flavobacterium sp. TSSA_36 TaxID=3447669 RepID=UPI003F3BF840